MKFRENKEGMVHTFGISKNVIIENESSKKYEDDNTLETENRKKEKL